MLIPRLLMSLAVVGILSASSFAQRPDRNRPGGNQGARTRGGSGMAERFNKSTPEIGEALPNISLFDDQGKKFNLMMGNVTASNGRIHKYMIRILNQ